MILFFFHFRQSVWECVKLPTWTQNNEKYASTRPRASKRDRCFHMQYSLCINVCEEVCEAEGGQNEISEFIAASAGAHIQRSQTAS